MKTRRSQKVELPNCTVEIEEIPEENPAPSPEIPVETEVESSLKTLSRMKRKRSTEFAGHSGKKSKNDFKKPEKIPEKRHKKEPCKCEKVAQEEFFRLVERYCPDNDEEYAQCLLDMCHFYKFGEHVMHDLINAKKKIFVLEMQLKKLTNQKPVDCCTKVKAREVEIAYDSGDESV